MRSRNWNTESEQDLIHEKDKASEENALKDGYKAKKSRQRGITNSNFIAWMIAVLTLTEECVVIETEFRVTYHHLDDWIGRGRRGQE